MESLLGHLQGLQPSSIYLAVVGILLLCGLGIPIPEDIPMVTGGYLAHTGVIDVHLMFAFAFAAVIVGDSAAFFMGRRWGRRVLASRFARRSFTPRKQLRVRAYFRKYGSKVVFVARFMPGLRFTIFFSAGTLHLRPGTFIVYDSLAALISVPLLVYASWYFGDYIDSVIKYARRTEHGILVGVGVAAAIVAVRLWRKAKARRSPGPQEPPAEEQVFPPVPGPPVA